MKKLRVRLYFKPKVVWFYQVINGECHRDSLIGAWDRNQAEIDRQKEIISKFGLAQKPEFFTHTIDLTKRIKWNCI